MNPIQEGFIDELVKIAAGEESIFSPAGLAGAVGGYGAEGSTIGALAGAGVASQFRLSDLGGQAGEAIGAALGKHKDVGKMIGKVLAPMLAGYVAAKVTKSVTDKVTGIVSSQDKPPPPPPPPPPHYPYPHPHAHALR
jgi:hypothetical protein